MIVHGKVIKLLITILMVGLSSAAYSKDYQAGKNFTVIHSTVKQPPPLVEFFPSTADLVMRLQSASMLIQLSESACPTI